MCEIASRATEAGAEVDDLGVAAKLRTSGQCIIGGSAAVVVLIVREQLLRAQSVEGAAR